MAQFGHNRELLGFTPFRDLWLQSDKNRTEYTAKGGNSIVNFMLGIENMGITHGGSVVTVFDRDQGWMLDKGGVSSEPEDAVKAFTEQVQTGLNNVLRSRKNEPGMGIRYAGSDLVDLKEAEWIEFSDRDHRALRLAVDKATHLPLRWVVETRDLETRARTETVTSYAQYVSMDGIQTPLGVSRAQNDRSVSQVFYTGCKYNANLSPQLFTRASLEQRFTEAGKKSDKK